MTVDFKEYSRRMDKALEHLDEEFASVRAGRANAKVLDRITVEYYGSETPLNGVAGFADVLAGRPGLDAEAVRQARQIRQSSDGLLMLVEDILDFARGEDRREDVP